jgi:hypothetical protein
VGWVTDSDRFGLGIGQTAEAMKAGGPGQGGVPVHSTQGHCKSVSIKHMKSCDSAVSSALC